METLSMHYQDNVRRMNELLGVGRNCDMVSRDYLIGGRHARIWVVDGFGQDAVLERMGAVWLSLSPQDVGAVTETLVRCGQRPYIIGKCVSGEKGVELW